MSRIYDGVRAFQDNVFSTMQPHFSDLANGQQPETLFITCSDSRIDPALMTQSKPGEIFVIRNAGNIVPKPGAGELGVEATLQYAVDVLQVKEIVVCGHSKCGAVSGLMDLASLESLPVIKQWVLHSEAVIDQVPEGPARIEQAIEANVMLQLDNLMLFDCVRDAVEAKRLTLHGWVYHFETGQVQFLSQPSQIA